MKTRSISAGDDARLIWEREARLKSLDTSIARGVADADAGRVRSTREVFDDVEARLEAIKRSAPNQNG